MKRYYLSDIIGNGDADAEPTPTTGGFRPAVADYGLPFAPVIPTDPETGRPTKSWSLVLVASASHVALRSDPRIDPLPDFPLDAKVSGIDGSVRAAMIAAMTRRGIDTSIVSGADGYRDLIRALGQMLDAAFDEENFDVADPANG